MDKSTLIKIIVLIRSVPTTEPNFYPIVETATEYIKANLAEEVFIPEIAAKVNTSVSYLSYLFKSVTGISITEYRNEMRLTAAKQMLISTGKSIKDISSACGFNSPSYFAEVFTRSERVSPSEFRKYHQTAAHL